VDLARSTIAVTGATGFVGRYLTQALVLRGAHVVAVVRNPSKAPPEWGPHVEVRRADLADRSALTQAFRGADAIFANAGLVSVGGKSQAELVHTNVRGTENTLQAATEAGVGRVVMTSSAAAYARQPEHRYREDHPLRDPERWHPRPLWYPASKAAAERFAWAYAQAQGTALTTVRPHSIHGAFDQVGFTLWLARFMSLPVAVFPTHVYFPSVYAGDLAEAMCRMLETPSTAGRAYNITNAPDQVTFWDLQKAWRAAGGRSPHAVLPIPFPMRRTYDITRAQQDIAFTNRPLLEVFAEIVAAERAGRLA
jgi:nucleoside-diphosphate-sugar epimerase